MFYDEILDELLPFNETKEEEDSFNSYETLLDAEEKEAFDKVCGNKVLHYDRGFISNSNSVRALLEKPDLKEYHATVKEIYKYCLELVVKGARKLVLLPIQLDEKIKKGTKVYVITEVKREDEFLYYILTEEEYAEMFGDLDKDVNEKAYYIEKCNNDPEGYALWKQMGLEKRTDDYRNDANNKIKLSNRAEMVLKRIPKDRDDLYDLLKYFINRYNFAANNERADYEEILDVIEKLIVMTTKESDEAYKGITVAEIMEIFPDAKITLREDISEKDNTKCPNIMITGKNYKEILKRLKRNSRNMNEINMGGVEGNDYLFGDEMTYYCSGIGVLTKKLVKEGTYATDIVFKNIDFMGTTVRSSNPFYGLCTLLLDHKYNDFHIRGLDINVENTTFICHVNDKCRCPEFIKAAMDVIIEL